MSKDKLLNENDTDNHELKEEMSEYERYCREQAEMFFDGIGEDRCFGDMAEGQFVRSH